MLQQGSQPTMVNRKKSHYMLGGLGILKCQKCGSNMHSQKVTSHGSSYPVYYCPNHKDKKCTTKDIKAEPLNKFVASVLTDELKSRKDFSNIISLVNQNDELDLLYRRLNGNKVALQNNLHIYEHNPLTRYVAVLKRHLSHQMSWR